jgi:HPt (histidine-containing phosphotransfer) domain-containing protein
VETPKSESQQETAPSLPTDENTPIYIDIEQVSQTIGISPDDYNLFLNEYIDTALTFEEALQSQDEEKKREALHTLSHLSNVLHLPFVGELLNRIKNASLSERDQAIEAFFTTLGRLTTADFEEEKKAESDETVQTIQADAGEEVSEEIVEARRPTIDLSDIKPVHFDFQLEEAAKDLSLPVELIEEFVHDFIKQAHEETQKMIEAYEKGDLDTVQKIGHLLKGTSSNLRINPLADTLYEIQFNDDIDRVPELVRHYWAHFLSLENQIKLIAKK